MKSPLKVGIFVCGILLSLVVSGGLLYLSWAFILQMVQEAGRNISMGQILFALFLVIAMVITIPGGHIYFYLKLKRSRYFILAYGLISGFFLMLAFFCGSYIVEQIEKNQATAPHSEEYLNFQYKLFLEKERERIADSLKYEKFKNSENYFQDSLKRAADSILQEAKNEKDWQKVLR